MDRVQRPDGTNADPHQPEHDTMSADKDRGIRRQKQKRAKQLKRQAREAARTPVVPKSASDKSGRS